MSTGRSATTVTEAVSSAKGDAGALLSENEHSERLESGIPLGVLTGDVN